MSPRNNKRKPSLNGHVNQLSEALPPHSVEAEQGVIGGLLLNPEHLTAVRDLIGPRDFFRDPHAVLFQGICDLADKGIPVDPITLTEHLKPAGLYGAAGGDAAIIEAMERMPHAENTVYYAGIVREKAVAREVIGFAGKVIADAYAGNKTGDQLVGTLSRHVTTILTRREQQFNEAVDNPHRLAKQFLAGHPAMVFWDEQIWMYHRFHWRPWPKAEFAASLNKFVYGEFDRLTGKGDDPAWPVTTGLIRNVQQALEGLTCLKKLATTV